MTFEEAIRKSIKAYFDGKDPSALIEAKGGIKYDRAFFDKLEEDIVEPKNLKKAKKTKTPKGEEE
jgi:hypothetical protein